MYQSGLTLNTRRESRVCALCGASTAAAGPREACPTCKGRTHAHTDGGLIIFRAGAARDGLRAAAREAGGFDTYVSDALQSASAPVRGVDEMLLDGFFASHLKPSAVVLVEHRHKIQAVAPPPPRAADPRAPSAAALPPLDVSYVFMDIGDGTGAAIVCCQEVHKRGGPGPTEAPVWGQR